MGQTEGHSDEGDAAKVDKRRGDVSLDGQVNQMPEGDYGPNPDKQDPEVEHYGGNQRLFPIKSAGEKGVPDEALLPANLLTKHFIEGIRYCGQDSS